MATMATKATKTEGDIAFERPAERGAYRESLPDGRRVIARPWDWRNGRGDCVLVVIQTAAQEDRYYFRAAEATSEYARHQEAPAGWACGDLARVALILHDGGVPAEIKAKDVYRTSGPDKVWGYPNETEHRYAVWAR